MSFLRGSWPAMTATRCPAPPSTSTLRCESLSLKPGLPFLKCFCSIAGGAASGGAERSGAARLRNGVPGGRPAGAAGLPAPRRARQRGVLLANFVYQPMPIENMRGCAAICGLRVANCMARWCCWSSSPATRSAAWCRSTGSAAGNCGLLRPRPSSAGAASASAGLFLAHLDIGTFIDV